MNTKKLMLSIAREMPNMGVLHVYDKDNEADLMWSRFGIAYAPNENLGLKGDYIYAYKNSIDIKLPKADYELKDESGNIISLYKLE